MKQYPRILGYLRPYSGLFLVSVTAMVVFATLDAFSLTLLIPFLDVLFQDGAAGGAGGLLGGDDPVHQLLNRLLGSVVATDSAMEGLRNVTFIMFFVFLVRNVAMYVEAYTVRLIQQRVTRDIRNQIYAHLLRLGLPFFQQTKTGQIISRATHDVDQMRSLITENLAKALSSVIQATVVFGVLMALSWKLTLVTLLTIPLMLGLWDRFRKRLRLGVLKVLDAVGELSSHIQERVSGIRLVKASGAEAWECERFEQLTHTHYKAVIRNERWRQLFPPATEMITAVAILALLLYGSRLVLVNGSLEASAFLAFLLMTMRVMSPVKWLGHFPSVIQPGLAASERAFELLDTRPQIVEQPDARGIADFREHIVFDGVSFRYTTAPDAKLVLHDVHAEIKQGQVVALVGPSGSGKTTLASLLSRFYDPTAGRILIDGVNVQNLRVADLRRLIGIVTQETVLFHDTVRASIAYGLPDASDAEIEAAAKAAHAHEFIQALPQGYETVLGERGTRLSGGQRQRIAIARALLRNPPILILDEATSALDTQSEMLVQRALDTLLEGRTVLVIAHRLSTVRRADQILVMDEGRIVQRGSHDELLARGGLYRTLYRLQFAVEDEHAVQAAAGSGGT